MGSSTSPTTPIWKKWSITQMLAKPDSSAVLAISANLGPIEVGASGQVKRGTCNPMRNPVSSVLRKEGPNPGLPIILANRDDQLQGTERQTKCMQLRSTRGHVSHGVVRFALVKDSVALKIQSGVWYHKSYARSAEVRASAGHLPPPRRPPVLSSRRPQAASCPDPTSPTCARAA